MEHTKLTQEQIDNMSDKEINKVYDKMLNDANMKGEDSPSKLSDGEFKQLAQAMENVLNDSEDLQMISKLPSNNGVLEANSNLKNTEEDVLIDVNVFTGEHVITGQKPKEHSEEESNLITDTFEDLIEGSKNHKMEDVKLTDDIIIKTLKEQFDGISEIEIMGFVSLIKDYQNGNTSGVYNRLPNTIKGMINSAAATASNSINPKILRGYKERCAKDLIDSFINDATFGKITIEFQDELDKVFKDANNDIGKLYSESIKEKEIQLTKIIDSLEEKNESEKAETFRKILAALKETYTFDLFKKELPKIKIKKFDLEKPEKIYRDFDYKYQDSVYNIKSSSLLAPTLFRLFPEYHKEIIMRFVIGFCKFCSLKGYTPSNVDQHTFMYYFISNIIYLGSISLDENNEFNNDLFNNIKECLDIICNR